MLSIVFFTVPKLVWDYFQTFKMFFRKKYLFSLGWRTFRCLQIFWEWALHVWGMPQWNGQICHVRWRPDSNSHEQVFTWQRGQKRQHKNKRNNPRAKRFSNETADLNALVLKHFAPSAHHNMSSHLRAAPQCQVGTLGDDNAFTCVTINADNTSKFLLKS